MTLARLPRSGLVAAALMVVIAASAAAETIAVPTFNREFINWATTHEADLHLPGAAALQRRCSAISPSPVPRRPATAIPGTGSAI